MTTISIRVEGIEDVTKSLQKVSEALNPVELLDEGAAILLNRVRTRFRQETDPDGIRWIPSKAAIKRGGKTLLDTGRLFHSIQLSASGPDSRTISTDVPYAQYHNFGIGQERRMFMGFADDDNRLVVNFIARRIKDALKNG